MSLKTHSFFSLLVILVSFLGSCNSSKNLVSVLVEDKNGNTELIYQKYQQPENLVTEIKYYPNGDTLSVTPMQKGAVHGVLSSYHKGNRLKEQITFNNGKQEGVFKRFDKEGVLVFEGNLVDGLKSGVWSTWYDDVQKEEQRTYANDFPNGKWTYWYIDGNLKREEVYKDGKLIEQKDYN